MRIGISNFDFGQRSINVNRHEFIYVMIQKAEYRKRDGFCLAHHPNAGTPFANLA